jgi:hypothetical protein
MSEDQEVKRTFQVEIEQVKRHLFVVDDVNSQEEAEDVAEEWLNDGEEGAVIEEEITSYDSYPIDPKEDIH